MKKATALFAGSLVALLATGPSFAQSSATTGDTTTSAPSNSAAPAKKPSMFSMPHRVTGEVVAADPAANTLTVKDSKGKEYAFSADSDAATRLGDLRVGDRVKVDYKKSKGQMVATKIVEAKESSRATK